MEVGIQMVELPATPMAVLGFRSWLQAVDSSFLPVQAMGGRPDGSSALAWLRFPAPGYAEQPEPLQAFAEWTTNGSSLCHSAAQMDINFLNKLKQGKWHPFLRLCDIFLKDLLHRLRYLGLQRKACRFLFSWKSSFFLHSRRLRNFFPPL